MRDTTKAAAAAAAMIIAAALLGGCSRGDDHDWSSGSYPRPPSSSPSTEATSALSKQPTFGKTVSLSDKPPPLSGGTLAVSHDGKYAVASDPDRDHIYVVDLKAAKVVRDIELTKGDEPGRVIEDRWEQFHIVLRGAGAVMTIVRPDSVAAANAEDGGAPPPASSTDVLRNVCSSPRGIALQRASSSGGTLEGELLLIVCEGGEVMQMAPGGVSSGKGVIDATLMAMLEERDLRDVVATHDQIFVSTFRTARIIELTRSGAYRGTTDIQSVPASSGASTGGGGGDTPMLAFRMVAAPETSGASNNDDDDAPIIVHESASPGALPTASGTYYSTGSCGQSSVVTSLVSKLGAYGGSIYLPTEAVLPVDIARAADHDTVAIIAAGNAHTQAFPQLLILKTNENGGGWRTPCGADVAPYDPKDTPQASTGDLQLTSVAFRNNGSGGDNNNNNNNYSLVVQSREPAALLLLPEGTRIPLSTVSREDTGHAIFHSNSGRGAACASCHAEGADDGHVWTFVPQGQRRTPSLRGTLKGTAPYHWDGDEKDVSQLMDDVLGGRMGGPELNASQKNSIEQWLFALPPPKPHVAATDVRAVSGKALFEREDVGCASCHSGPLFTNGKNVNVGTGGSFQVPSLVGVGARTPLMHNGCAQTIQQRFVTSCGGANHGKTLHLSTEDITDLAAYLESL